MKTKTPEVEQLILRGVELQNAGKTDSAVSIYRSVLESTPSHPVALYSLAAICLNRGDNEEGMACAQRCLSSASASPLAWYIHGVALKAARRFDEALVNFDHALSLDPNYVEPHLEKANIYFEGRNISQSLSHLDKALSIDPSHRLASENRACLLRMFPAQTEALSDRTLRGLAHQNAGDTKAAREVFLQILAEDDAHFVSLYSLSAMAINEGDKEAGILYGARCLNSEPGSPYGWYIHGCALKACRRFPEALRHLDRALELDPTYKEAMFEKGILFGETKDYVQALIQFNQILQTDSGHKLALVNLATTLTILNRHDEGSQFFDRLLQVDPEHDYVLGALTHARLHCCNWTDFEANRDLIVRAVQSGRRSCKPLAFLAISDSPQEQLLCAKIFSEQAYPISSEQFWSGERFSHPKLRIGYVSPDLREHPVGHLMAGVVEHHDKARFEVYSFSLGIDDNSSLRQRFVAASDRFFDVRGRTSREIAKLIRESEIDVLIDLAGPTMDAQPDIFAFKPAPIQAGYLGYPGTSGASYYDYILADKIVIPDSDRPFYSEDVIHLPGCYLPTDSQLSIAERTPTREEVNLPPEGFVFCSFNHDYKMNPDNFGAWMRILNRVPKSVLWLMKLNDAAESNLRREAESRGVSASRLIFATRVPDVADHLARYRLADIFLDTYPYNAHSTATDALRAGLPVLTLTGKSFQSRVATSILNTIGMPQLAKSTVEEYEDFAVEMACSPEKLQKLKKELAKKNPNASIFDTRFAAERLEEAFVLMAARSASIHSEHSCL
jgi:predicted O-linked N-acetylglucosamine transferase (SPINDLY family)